MVDQRGLARGLPDRAMIEAGAPRFPGLDARGVQAALTAEARAARTTRPMAFNHGTAFREASLLRCLLNGVIVTASIFLTQVVVALPCAYALAKLRFWGARPCSRSCRSRSRSRCTPSRCRYVLASPGWG